MHVYLNESPSEQYVMVQCVDNERYVSRYYVNQHGCAENVSVQVLQAIQRTRVQIPQFTDWNFAFGYFAVYFVYYYLDVRDEKYVLVIHAAIVYESS